MPDRSRNTIETTLDAAGSALTAYTKAIGVGVIASAALTGYLSTTGWLGSVFLLGVMTVLALLRLAVKHGRA